MELTGMTLTSGFTYTPPPPENTAGWWAGGYLSPTYSRTSTVQRITFATDTAIASVRGPLSGGKSDEAAASNFTYGWFGGGNGPGGGSTVDRITFATDTATASVRGPLSLARSYFAAAGNTTDGWFGAGVGGPLSSVDRITYATDTATASVRGPLSMARYLLAATSNTTDAWFGGGYIQTDTTTKSRVDRITFATDTATASVRGPLSADKQR